MKPITYWYLQNSQTLTVWIVYVPLYRLSQRTNNNPAFGHIVCQPIRSLQVGPDLPDRPHVSVKRFEIYTKTPKHYLLMNSNWIDKR